MNTAGCNQSDDDDDDDESKVVGENTVQRTAAIVLIKLSCNHGHQGYMCFVSGAGRTQRKRGAADTHAPPAMPAYTRSASPQSSRPQRTNVPPVVVFGISS